MSDIGFLQVKVLKATDLLAADLNGSASLEPAHLLWSAQSLTSRCLFFFFSSREERSLLRAGARQRPAADPHRLQEPLPGVEQSLRSVSLGLFSPPRIEE